MIIEKLVGKMSTSPLKKYSHYYHQHPSFFVEVLNPTIYRPLGKWLNPPNIQCEGGGVKTLINSKQTK